ncbi:tRNA (adenine(22)-N(1))-methyltransferase [Limosilactobacillus secaliphilus]|uniref:SAM-dependent methyltransferase n=1 Tax=Limosilactobacillus secaliphilus TaxID=396268 RepID=A0A0R2IA87_9LACO|nr:class I SAM-dependent methyltransferase [Limosilactobacillus secaliphilus]KRN58836.1 hypothetical protein IV45_GL000463 [Limosilactobacillus secaliphilus]
MDERHLSKRLQAVADLVPDNARLADIGSDHAYLPAALLLADKIKYAVAGEVAKGPFENEKAEINKLQMQDCLIPRLADGLDAIENDDHIDTVVIAGMGGSLIEEILDRGQDKLAGVKHLILQPNIGEYRLRKWLMEHHFQIMHEELLADEGHRYEIILAEPSICPVRYNQRELLFGPLLLEHQGPLFDAKWQSEAGRLEQALTQMAKAQSQDTQRKEQLQAKLNLIKGVIGNDHGE